jgi:SAM-dependent methyltransferase
MITSKDENLIQEIESFLLERSKKYGRGTLWNWALIVPHERRLNELFEKSGDLSTFLKSKNPEDTISVLDLGCGFCTMWPFFQERGCNKFIGIDLFRLRGQGDQAYQKTSGEVADKFCSQSIYYILEGDVRDIDELFSMYEVEMEEKFDIIFTKNTNYTKLGSTGIPPEVFENICDRWLKSDGIKIYAG